MSVIEDSRKALQDFIAPELRAIDVRLAALEKRFDEAQLRTDKRFDDLNKHLDQRFEQVLAEIRQLNSIHDLELRMAKYEAMTNKQNPGSGSEAA
jgi:hypothetical protein